VLGASLFAVVAYSHRGLRFKEVPFLDSATSAAHFVSPAVYGLVLAGADPSVGVVALCAGFFLWSMASQAFGAVQDVRADREGGLRSIATVLGARPTVWAALVLYLAAGLLLLLVPWPGPLASLLVLPYLANLVPFLTITDAGCARANRGWRRFLWLNYLTGFLVTLLLLWSWELAH
jgi:4-hydroxybenzoate polyprenyltransferase